LREGDESVMPAVQRFLTCWVQVSFADALAAQAQERQAAPGQLRYLQKRQESAGRCVTEAVKQLALARRMVNGRSKAVRLVAQDLPGIPLPGDNRIRH
jgi:hypothetical protein